MHKCKCNVIYKRQWFRIFFLEGGGGISLREKDLSYGIIQLYLARLQEEITFEIRNYYKHFRLSDDLNGNS